MKYKIQIIGRQHKNVEAVVGDNLDEDNAEKLLEQTQLLIDKTKYEVKIINAF